jgi:excisionase family DNA binding protein
MDKDTGQHRTGKSDSGHTGHNIGHIGQLDVLSLWLSTNEILDRLGVSSRTLRRMVKRGEVERRKVGRECRYRARKADTPDTQGGHWTHRTAVTQSGQVAAIRPPMPVQTLLH